MRSGRPALTSRAQIIKAARRILRKHGIDGLSVRTVAAALATAPSTIYNYFGTKQGMLAALANDMLEDARPKVDTDEDPIIALRHWMIQYRQLLLKTPDLIVLANASGPVASVFKISHDLFDLLKRAGFSDQAAAIEARSLHWTVNGFVLQEIGQKKLGIDMMELAPEEELQVMRLMQRVDFDQLFIHTIDRNIDGLRCRLQRS
jgi:AcrR family transcriptional regulator